MRDGRSRPAKVTAKEKKIALLYLRGDITRAEVNRAFNKGAGSLSGLHKVARALKTLFDEKVLVESYAQGE